MKRASRRTWALGTLDRNGIFTLWFDTTTNRWEVERQGSLVEVEWSDGLDQIRPASP